MTTEKRLGKLKRKYAKGGKVKSLKELLQGRDLSDQRSTPRVLDLNDPKLANPEDDVKYKKSIEELKRKIAKTKVLDLNDPSLPSRKKTIGQPSPIPLHTGKARPSPVPPARGSGQMQFADDILMMTAPRDPALRSQMQTQLHEMIMSEPSTTRKLRALQKMNELMGDVNQVTDEDLVQYMQSMGGGFAKGGAIGRLSKLMAKQEGDRPVGGPPAQPPGPLFVDSYGQAYNTPDELLVGIREAVEDESDEPRWTDAAAMLKKLPGTEPAQQALATLMRAYDDPNANFDQALSAWTQAIDSIMSGAKPAGFAKGGAVKGLKAGPGQVRLSEDGPLRRLHPTELRRVKAKQKALSKSEEEKGRELKLSTFAKGGKVKNKLKAIRGKMR